MRVPAALVAIPLIVGCSAGLLLPELPVSRLAVCGAGASLICLIAACGALGQDDGLALVAATVAGCLTAGVSLGVSAAQAAYAPALLAGFDTLPVTARGDPAVLDAVLREDASAGPAGWSLTLDVSRVNGRLAAGGARVTVLGMAADEAAVQWRAGRRVRLPAVLRRPAFYQDPGVADEARALARRGIVLVGSVKSASLVDVVDRAGRIDEAAAAARRWARTRLGRFVGRWSRQSAAIAAAILIGDRSGLSDEDQRRLQEAGTYHVIAISGGNIAILTTLLLVGLRMVRLPARVAALVATAVLLFYGRLTGNSPSVSRAVLAASVFLAGRVLDHRGPPLNALSVAAIAAVGYSPLVVFDAGFILSFGASLGILVGAPRLLASVRGARQPAAASPVRRRSAAARFRKTVAAPGVALLAATVCAELAILPVGAAVFSRVTFAGLILNFAAIPLMTVVQAASMATLGVAALAWIAGAPAADGMARLAGWVTHEAASWLVRSAGLVDVAPWLSRDVLSPGWPLILAYYAAALMWLTKRGAPAGLAALAIVVGLILAGPPVLARGAVSPPRPGWLRVVFLDVGQGDATLVRLPDGDAMLVDAGGVAGTSFDIGERVVAPALRALGVWRLDTLVLTHGDPDHIGGAPTILRRFRPISVWEGVPVPPHVKLREVEEAVGLAGAAWRDVQSGDRERRGAVEIRVLHPPSPDWERQRVRNDDSIVLELRLGDVSVILPGDVGAEGERAVIPRLAPARLSVLKAPHHGSLTSSTPAFIAAVRPAAVIFSAGRDNRFGHPAPAVVDRYRTAGAAIFRTDRDGAIVLDTDGRSILFSHQWGHSPLR